MLNKLLLIIVFLSSCGGSNKIPPTQEPKTILVDPAESITIDYIPSKFDKECLIGLNDDIHNYKLWVYDSVYKVYKTDTNFVKAVRWFKYSCLYDKDTAYISGVFGKDYVGQTLKEMTKDSISYTMTYTYKFQSPTDKNYNKIVFPFKNGKLVNGISVVH